MANRLIFILLTFILHLHFVTGCLPNAKPRYVNSFENDYIVKYNSFDSFAKEIHKRFFVCCHTSDYSMRIDTLSKRLDSSVSMFDLTDDSYKVDCKKGLPHIYLKNKHLYHFSTTNQSKYNGFFMTYVYGHFYVFNMTKFDIDNSKNVIDALIKHLKENDMYTRKIEHKVKRYMKYRCFYGWMG